MYISGPFEMPVDSVGYNLTSLYRLRNVSHNQYTYTKGTLLASLVL